MRLRWDRPAKPGGQHDGQELGLVADLGDGHEAGGDEEGFQGGALSDAAIDTTTLSPRRARGLGGRIVGLANPDPMVRRTRHGP